MKISSPVFTLDLYLSYPTECRIHLGPRRQRCELITVIMVGRSAAPLRVTFVYYRWIVLAYLHPARHIFC